MLLQLESHAVLDGKILTLNWETWRVQASLPSHGGGVLVLRPARLLLVFVVIPVGRCPHG